MSLLRGPFAVLFLLTAFVAAKGSFWLAIGLPVSAPTTTEKPIEKAAQPVSHPCACSGAPVCRCGPVSCCASQAEVAVIAETGPQMQTVPTVCGQLYSGLGLGGEAVMLALALTQDHWIDTKPEFLPHPLAHALVSVSLSPDSPPPKV